MIFELTTHWTSGHFYRRQELSEAQNRELFGRCANLHGHGHDYQLRARFELESELSPAATAEVLDNLKRLLFELRESLDHQHLNFAIPAFQKQIPTTENLSLFCAETLKLGLKDQKVEARLLGLKLFETDDLWVELDFP